MKLEERLNETIAEKESEIENLKEKIEEYEESKRLLMLRWQKHERFTESE